MCNTISKRILEIKSLLPNGVELVAVSKFHSFEELRYAYDAGQRLFGESVANELVLKAKEFPNDIKWHFIGHLQRNKVKQVLPYVTMIESIDSARLLEEVNKVAQKINRVVDVLLEIHLAKEENKHGFRVEECCELFDEGWHLQLSNVRICGLMMMATHTDDKEQVKGEMQQASLFFDKLKVKYFFDKEYFKEKSWGMSGDYEIALQTGCTIVRLGTTIFGERKY